MKLIKTRDFIIIDVHYVCAEKPLANSSRTLCLRSLKIEGCDDCAFGEVCEKTINTDKMIAPVSTLYDSAIL